MEHKVYRRSDWDTTLLNRELCDQDAQSSERLQNAFKENTTLLQHFLPMPEGLELDDTWDPFSSSHSMIPWCNFKVNDQCWVKNKIVVHWPKSLRMSPTVRLCWKWIGSKTHVWYFNRHLCKWGLNMLTFL